MKGYFLALCLVFLSSSALAAETVDVSLSGGKITAQRLTVNHDDFLNICSRDSAFHQPYSLSPQNKFGSSKAKEKDILPKDQCRIERVKNTSGAVQTITIYDRFHPHAYLAIKVNPKPPKVKSDLAKGDPGKPDKFPTPMMGGQHLAYCYTKDNGCGTGAANAWCKSKGFKEAKEFEVLEAPEGKTRTTKYIGDGKICKSRDGSCDMFESISCKKDPPTFF